MTDLPAVDIEHGANAVDIESDFSLELDGITAGYWDTIVVRDASLRVQRGHIVGLAGESGSGKSTLALAAMGVRTGGLVIHGGRSLVGGDDLLTLGRRELRSRWGSKLAYVPQGAAASLNLAHTVATHFRLVFRRHLGLRRRASDARAVEWLERVGLPPDALRRYPHQFSGGQQQRISLALALSCGPDAVILDEPTAGLDVTTQAQITALLRQMVDDLGIAAICVSHDLALLGDLADDLAVMYAGELVEVGSSAAVLGRGRHPYSRALLAAVPSLDAKRMPVGIAGSPPSEVVDVGCAFAARCEHVQDDCRAVRPALVVMGELRVRCLHPLAEPERAAPQRTVVAEGDEIVVERATALAAWGITSRHRTPSGPRAVVEAVDLSIGAGETLALVGESGSGKSTLLRTLAGIHPDADGDIVLAGHRLLMPARRREREDRAAIQIVFQNSDLALNPRHSIGDAIGRSLKLFRPDVAAADRRSEAATLLEVVRLPASFVDRLPGELSGGQRQRVAFARAFAARPKVLLCDEVTSALDVSVQATILTLIRDLSRQFDSAVLFVSHDLAVVRSIADRIAVMQAGRICETATTADLFNRPQHPYTRQLLAAVPSISPEGRSRSLTGVV